MTVDTEVLLRRTRALVSAVALLQQSRVGSATYAGFRAKVEKGLGLVLASVGEVLRAALAADGEDAAVLAALTDPEVLRRAGERGLLSAEETERWSTYFAEGRIAPDADFAEETLVLLRSLLVDAHSLERILRSQ